MTGERLIDAVHLDPPVPLQLALQAVDELSVGEYIRLQVSRDPVLLYPMLVMQGCDYASHSRRQSFVEVFIWRRGDRQAASLARKVIDGGDGA